MEVMMLSIYISDDCHRECQYCYRPLSSSKMTSQVADDLSTWIADVAIENKLKDLYVWLLGGEPTNNIDIALRFTRLLRCKLPNYQDLFYSYKKPGVCSSDRRGLQRMLFTNGDLLTEPMLKELKEENIRIVLNPTYDGLKEFEDKLLFVKNICGGCRMSIALNDINLARLPELTKLAIKHNSHMRINRLYHGGTIPGYVEEYAKQMSKMFDLLLEAERPMWPNWIMESTYPQWKGPKNPYTCGRRFAAIDTGGIIRGCNPDMDTKIGSIYTHKHWSDLVFPQRWSAKNLPECQGCDWITLCQGGCPYTRKLAFGTYDHKSPFCEAFKKLFPKLMLLTKKWEEKYARDAYPGSDIKSHSGM